MELFTVNFNAQTNSSTFLTAKERIKFSICIFFLFLVIIKCGVKATAMCLQKA